MHRARRRRRPQRRLTRLLSRFREVGVEFGPVIGHPFAVRTRILHLTPGCFDKGGISRYCRFQIRAWRELFGERQVRVLSLTGPEEDAFEEPFPVDWYHSTRRIPRKLDFFAHTLAYALKTRPAIIHSAHVNMAGMAKAIADAVGARTLLNVYGLEVWSGLRRDAEHGLRHSELVLSDCHFTARWLAASGYRPESSTAVIWDCVDLEHYRPGVARREVLAKYGIPDPSTGINILTLGRMTPGSEHKGYDRLLQAFRHVAAETSNVRLVFAGRGSLADDLRAQANNWGIGDRVFFTGMVHEQDMPDVFRSGHIFSLVSDKGDWRGEGIPLTPLEAAACGLPIIVGNHDGSQEAPIQGESGYILDPFNLVEHARVMLHLCTDTEKREQMAHAARARAEAQFGYETFRDKHRAVIESWLPHLLVPAQSSHARPEGLPATGGADC